MSRRSIPDFLNVQPPTSTASALSALGWKPAFAAQLADHAAPATPARVTAVHRDHLALATGDGTAICTPFGDATVGDWLLLDPATDQPTARLDRSSLFKRRAPGSDRRTQLIAANVDTLFIVSSCNQDFNVARLERYLALAYEAQVTPVIVLTKSDLVDNPETYRQQAATIQPGLLVETLDATQSDALDCLRPWCAKGETVALVGSSGVGKSTISNALTEQTQMQTSAIREDDSKGRHTTSHRQMLSLKDGGWLIDTPGMRELQMADVRSGIDEVFADLTDLATQCRFRDCQHDTEPGCAITRAISAGDIDPARLNRWRKLVAEDTYNAKSLVERRASDKAFGKMIKSTTKGRRTR